VLRTVETRTSRKDDTKKLEAFEMWTWCCLLNINWIDHKTNE